jgi:hypothetical protein
MRMWTRVMAVGAGMALAACGMKPSENADPSVTQKFGKAAVVVRPGVTASLALASFTVTAQRISGPGGSDVGLPITKNVATSTGPQTGAYEFRFDTLPSGYYRFSAQATDDGVPPTSFGTLTPIEAQVPVRGTVELILLLEQLDNEHPDYLSFVPAICDIVMGNRFPDPGVPTSLKFCWRDPDDKQIQYKWQYRPCSGPLPADCAASPFSTIDSGNASNNLADCDPYDPTPAVQCRGSVETTWTPPDSCTYFQLWLEVTESRPDPDPVGRGPVHRTGYVFNGACGTAGAAEVTMCMNYLPWVYDLGPLNEDDTRLGAALPPGGTVKVQADVRDPDQFDDILCEWSLDPDCPFLSFGTVTTTGRNCAADIVAAPAAGVPDPSPTVPGKYCRVQLAASDLFSLNPRNVCAPDACTAEQPCLKGGEAEGTIWVWVGETGLHAPPTVVYATDTPFSARVGQIISLTVDAVSDYAPISYQWKVDDVEIHGAESATYQWTASRSGCPAAGSEPHTLSVDLSIVAPVGELTFTYVFKPIPVTCE